jgi:hypothetical protein
VEPSREDTIVKVLGYGLGAVVGGLAVFWAVYKVYNFISLF